MSDHSADHRAKLGQEGRTKETKAARGSQRVCRIVRVALGLSWVGFLGKRSLRWRFSVSGFLRVLWETPVKEWGEQVGVGAARPQPLSWTC